MVFEVISRKLSTTSKGMKSFLPMHSSAQEREGSRQGPDEGSRQGPEGAPGQEHQREFNFLFLCFIPLEMIGSV